MACLKASQFVPDIIIADITANNTKDILMLNRLRHSERTRNTPLLAIVPNTIKEKLEKALNERSSISNNSEYLQFHLIEYPFNFADLLKKVEVILQKYGKLPPKKQRRNDEEEQANFALEKKLFDPNISKETKLREVTEALHKQWVFPYTVIKALDIIGNESSCCNELAKCIQSDPSASAAILKVSNTVHYAKRRQRITDIKEAVVRLGFKQTRNLLACLALIDMSSETYGESGFTRFEFWLHSLTVAIIAAKLCEDSGFRRPELGFVAGLLHDLGKIPLDNNFKNVFPQLLEETTSGIDMFFRTEKNLMGFSHADLGHYLAQIWNFPQSISDAILNHHKPLKIMETTPALDRILQESVFVANQVAKAMTLGHSCDEIVREIPVEMLKDLQIPKGISEQFMASVISILNQLAKYLNIRMKPLTLSQSSGPVTDGEVVFVHGNHSEFHPIVLALRNSGYVVHVVKHMPIDFEDNIRVAISMPEVETPLDIMLYEDDQPKREESNVLKLYIVDIDPEKAPTKNFVDSNMMFLNQDHLDMRFVLHILDKFFGEVNIPDRPPEEPEKE